MDRERVETIVSPPPVDNVGSVDGMLTLKESPFSGQMTQAVQQAHNATLHWQGVIDSAVIITHSFDKKMEEEPASKKIKLEVVEVDLPEEETEADLELDIDECYKASIQMKKGGWTLSSRLWRS